MPRALGRTVEVRLALYGAIVLSGLVPKFRGEFRPWAILATEPLSDTCHLELLVLGFLKKKKKKVFKKKKKKKKKKKTK